MDEKERLPQVQEQIADLEEAIGDLQDNITALTTGLHPILTDDMGAETTAAAPDIGHPLVPLAKDLRLLKEKVLAEANRVALLTKRSEL